MAHRIWVIARVTGNVVLGCEVVPADVVFGRRGVELTRPPWAEAVLMSGASSQGLQWTADGDPPVLPPIDDGDVVLPPIDGDWTHALLSDAERAGTGGSVGEAHAALSRLPHDEPLTLANLDPRRMPPVVAAVGDLASISLAELLPVLEQAAARVKTTEQDVVLLAQPTNLEKVPWIVQIPTATPQAAAVVLVRPTSDE